MGIRCTRSTGTLAVTIEALEKVRGEHRVYNPEVEGDHEYFVGEAGVRAHNMSPCGPITDPSQLLGPGRSLVRTGGNYETYYGAMSPDDFAALGRTGRMPATSETFISPTRAFSESYKGILVRFQLAEGTTARLTGIGVRAHGVKSARLLPNLP